VHDGIAFERRGIPAAVICTEPFQPMGRATAVVAGLPDYAFLLVPHPMGRLSPEELRARAAETLPAVVALLVAQPAAAVDVPAPWQPDRLGLGSLAARESAESAETGGPWAEPADSSALRGQPSESASAREPAADFAGPAEPWPPVARD
jgi:hypothetical protein